MPKRFVITSLLLCILCLSVSGCTFSVTGYGGNSVASDHVTYEVSDGKDAAFAHLAEWVPGSGTAEIIIADTADGAPVTALGGFTGTGVPCAFSVAPAAADADAARYVSLPPDPSDLGVDITWQDEEITVRLGKNVTKIALPVSTGYTGIRQDDGSIAFYRPVLRFICDPENTVFTDQDGILCYRDSGLPVEETAAAQESLPSGPDFAALSLSDKLCGRYRYDINEEEYAVLEFFRLKSAGGRFLPEFPEDTVYVNIGLYRKAAPGDNSGTGAGNSAPDTLYVYSAAVLTPADVPAGYINVDPDKAGLYEVRCFSSFSLAGQYRDTVPSLYAVSAFAKDSLELAGVEVNGNALISADEAAEGPLILTRDPGAPSLFPNDPAVLADVLYTGEGTDMAKVMQFRPGYAWMPSSPVMADPAVIKLNADMTVEVIILPEEADAPPEIYRGVCGYRYEEKILDFYLTRLGYAAMPYTGSIRILWENDAITWQTLEGKDSFPFIPEGETEVTVVTH